MSGSYDADTRTVSLYMPWAGGTFDFHRSSSSQEAGYYARARTPPPYVYRPPLALDDGWPVGTLEEAGLSREAIAAFLTKLMAEAPDDVHALDVHGLLVARHGKLVLEEYLHGFHRDALHDTRSASKSLTSTLIGAAMLKGAPLRLDTPVYEAMNGGALPADLDERARTLKLEHLLSMSSGLDCDDSDPSSPGNEDVMQEQTGQPDWYRYTLGLKMIRAPGEKSVYCSVNPNLAGGVLARTSGRPLAELFDELIAQPLQIGRYALNLMPQGEPYMGGGARLLPRDFMKLGQVMLDGGRWHGRPIVSAEWARTSTSPLRDLGEVQYGHLWWSREYKYKERKVRAFFAAGNGGQLVLAVPDLDLLVAFYGGNYGEPIAIMAQNVFVPSYILPAVN
jgi:CubicO group peptidase (beta-lactamase class C family)